MVNNKKNKFIESIYKACLLKLKFKKNQNILRLKDLKAKITENYSNRLI
jgi:hypothetical protein